MNVRKVLSTIGSAAAALLIGQASAQELVIWHDLGDNGVKWFQAAGAEFAKTRPGVTVKSVSFPTEQWFGRAISSINTDTAPDLIYNNYERVIRVADQTNKLMDLRPVLASVSDKAFLSEDDLRVATHGNKMIILPVQRVQMALGVRKSWLDKVGEKFPATWADVQRVAVKFRDADPDGNGRADTFGMALQAAKPRDLIHMLDLFMFGSGLRHTVIDPQGKIVIDEPARAKVLEEVLKAYTEYRYMSPDTINHSFPEMYQIIEGGRAGMFRVGDWNVRKWDGPTVLKGDFLVGQPLTGARTQWSLAACVAWPFRRTLPTRHWRSSSPNSCSASRLSRPRSTMWARACARTSIWLRCLSASVTLLPPTIRSWPMISRKPSTPSTLSLRRPTTASCSPRWPSRRPTGRRSSPRPPMKCGPW
jgi:hypothetical protein